MFIDSLPKLSGSLHFSPLLLYQQYQQIHLIFQIFDKTVKEFCNIIRYGPVIQYLIFKKQKMPKKALDQLQSPIIKSSYDQNDKLMTSSSFIIGSYEAIEYTTLQTCSYHTRQRLQSHSATKLPISQSEFHLKRNELTITVCLNGISGKQMDQSGLCRQNYFTKTIYLEQLKLKILLKLSTQKKVRHISIFRIVKIYKFLKVLQQSHDKEMIQLKSQLVQLLYMDQKINPRVNANNKMMLLPPSQILHISNLKKVSSNAETMEKSFQNMVLLKLQKSYLCVQSKWKQQTKLWKQWHQCIWKKQNIQISFTKAKI
ncbi:unnamed protein product [Paramecium pentaurelia]|uniref:Uncharacterized protein n=1 Tax=Paramecium pentaurelia TaxID=43138 RepID=A0A8S1U705_9CILI|nr:unnamed protein product [Paramecium pentaurelia]